MDDTAKMAAYDDFNPRSREGSDSPTRMWRSTCLISIHAPVKGATCQVRADGDPQGISIHAPVKGATRSLDMLDR